MTSDVPAEPIKRRESVRGAWKAFTGGQPLPAGFPDPVILHSWERSRSAGVPHEGPPRFRRVPAEDLEARLKSSRALIHLTEPHLRWLSATMGQENHVVYLADPDGVVLRSETNDPESLETFGLAPGYDWSEATMGTNGAGTALAAKGPVAVVGCEHYSRIWHDMSCLAAPIRSPAGRLGGALDLSLETDLPRPDLLMRVAYTAHVIEREWTAYLAPRPKKGNLVKCRDCGQAWVFQSAPALCRACGSVQVHVFQRTDRPNFPKL